MWEKKIALINIKSYLVAYRSFVTFHRAMLTYIEQITHKVNVNIPWLTCLHVHVHVISPFLDVHCLQYLIIPSICTLEAIEYWSVWRPRNECHIYDINICTCIYNWVEINPSCISSATIELLATLTSSNCSFVLASFSLSCECSWAREETAEMAALGLNDARFDAAKSITLWHKEASFSVP